MKGLPVTEQENPLTSGIGSLPAREVLRLMNEEDARVAAQDAVIGLAASGRTPYTIGAVEHARATGAFTAAITCAPDSPITRAAEASIVAVVGPEVIAGSTRLKAGTAQKMVLNMIST